jgi:hypothetical protein
MLLLAINEAFGRRSVDILLTLHKGQLNRLKGDGVLELAGLIASGLVEIREYQERYGAGTPYFAFTMEYAANLTERGKLFVEGWLKGDQEAAIP